MTEKQAKSRRLQVGDLILEASGTNCGRSIVVNDRILESQPDPLVFSNFCRRFSVDVRRVLPQFLGYVLRLRFAEGDIQSYRTGSAMPNLDVAALSSGLEVPLPPLSEQRRIVGVLGALDDLIETTRQLSQRLRRLCEVLLSLFLANHDSRSERLGDLFDFRDGGAIGREVRSPTGQFPVMGANGEIGRTDQSNVSSSIVVLGKIGSAGALNVTCGPSWVTNNAFAVSAKRDWCRETVLALLRTVDFGSCVGGSANPYMPAKNFLHVGIEIPRGMDSLDLFARCAQDAIDSLDEERRCLIRARDELLPLLLSGRVSVREVTA